MSFAIPDSRKPAVIDHGIVYRKEDEFCAWPLYGGMWETADGSIVTGFERYKCGYESYADVNHDHVAESSKNELLLMRSTDRGLTWNTDDFTKLWDRSVGEADIVAQGPQNYRDEKPLDFRNRDVLVATGTTPTFGVLDARVWVRASIDGGRTWRRSIILPLIGMHALSATNASTVRSDGRSLLFLTSSSPDGWTRRSLVYASADGGHEWTFLSFITPKFDDGSADGPWHSTFRFGGHRFYYPRGIQLSDGRLLCTVRCQRDPRGVMWTEIYESRDGARTWQFLSRVNDWGAPSDICEMADGRIAVVYTYRLAPYGLRAKISEDGGRTWGAELILRDDGGSWDLGYPRLMERSAGELLVVYYFNSKHDPIQANGGVRHICRTVFRPD